MTRHITERQDFAVNRVFITLFVYKNGGNRVYYPNEIKPLQDGVKTNSAHYLVKLVADDSDLHGPTLYTLVVRSIDHNSKLCAPHGLIFLQVSQYEKNVDIYYSLRVYSTCEFSFTQMPNFYDPRYQQEVTGGWKGKTAGGCQNNHSTYKNNPLYQLVLNNREANNHSKSKQRHSSHHSSSLLFSQNRITCTQTISSRSRSDLYRNKSIQCSW